MDSASQTLLSFTAATWTRQDCGSSTSQSGIWWQRLHRIVLAVMGTSRKEHLVWTKPRCQLLGNPHAPCPTHPEVSWEADRCHPEDLHRNVAEVRHVAPDLRCCLGFECVGPGLVKSYQDGFEGSDVVLFLSQSESLRACDLAHPLYKTSCTIPAFSNNVFLDQCLCYLVSGGCCLRGVCSFQLPT